MSNPAVCFLANTIIKEIRFGIEDNLGESIHIHYGPLRAALSVEEFLNFSSEVEKAAEKLFEMQGLSWKKLDEASIKEEWVVNYRNISGVSERMVKLDQLFMKESYVQNRSIKRIIPLRESGYITLLKNKSNDAEYYMEQGQYEASRKEKIDAIVRLLKEKGYPFEEKKIVIDQQGYILDGIKRASGLYFLYGGDIEISVIQINIQWDKSLEERKKDAERQIDEFLGSQKLEKQEVEKKPFLGHKYKFQELLQYFNGINLKYVVLKREKQTQEGVNVYAEIIVEDESIAVLSEKLGMVTSQNHPYEKYQYLYAVERPISYDVEEGSVLVGSKICVKSKFNKQILPIEKEAEQWLINNKVFDEKSSCWILNKKAMLFIKILDCMLENETFTQRDIKFVSDHVSFLSDKMFCHLLHKEFFSYTDRLLCYLREGKYDKALQEYVTNTDYLLG